MVKAAFTRRGAIGAIGAAAAAGRAAPLRAETTGAAVDGVATVGPANATLDPDTGVYAVRLSLPDRPSRRALLGRRGPATPLRRRLDRLIASGKAAGLHGDVYDNRDRGHSALRRGDHAWLSVTAYDQAFRAADLDYGLNERLDFDAVVFGNSSTAVTAGPRWRSLPRLALTTPGAVLPLVRQYGRNQIYVYPEHRDHDPGRGDLFPANTPYCLISQGSSGSDRPLLEAVATILAALRPDAKDLLRTRGLIAPTVQTILRRALADAAASGDYLSGAAHPTVFEAGPLDPLRLVALAQAITPQTAPPLAAVAVLEEAALGPPADALADLAAERLFDTPMAAARVALGPAERRRYLLRAVGRDAAGGPAPVVWRLLRGRDVAVTPVGDDGAAAVVDVPWQTPAPVPGRPDVASARVDVAAFARGPDGYGPPAFFTVFFQQDRLRETDAAGRLLAVDYDAAPEGAYVDPVLSPLRRWRDRFDHAADGALLGWTRTRRNGATATYCRHGHRVLSRDAAGRPAVVVAVRYAYLDGVLQEGRRVVGETDGAERLVYDYAGPGDALGALRPAAAP